MQVVCILVDETISFRATSFCEKIGNFQLYLFIADFYSQKLGMKNS